ncbi:CvpA family protein [Candidatus Gottesmanbacteria bacterium]|nr:CvpA family protein [Candidatus Gottesmanbacteria bacterium]
MYFNWVDWTILVVLLYYFLVGWETGLVQLGAHFIAFLTSLWLAVKFHAPVGSFFTEKFGIGAVWTNVLGYLVVGFATNIILNELLNFLITFLPKKLEHSIVNKALGTVLSVINGLIIVAFFLLIVVALPLRGTVKRDIRESLIGRRLVVLSERYGGQVKSALDEQVREAIKFLTVEPKSTERIPLDVTLQSSDVSLDEASEKRMLELVNEERTKAGVKPLDTDNTIVTIARLHSKDMFIRRYFSHYDPDGHDALYRLLNGKVSLTVAGENIAYAPDVDVAHSGFMNSEGHRRNILDPQFHRIGIGVIDGGIYGKMFTQNFTD